MAIDKKIDSKFSKKYLNVFVKKLLALYPDFKSELNFTSEYELVVAVVLSAQCTDKRVNLVTPELFARYSNFMQLSKASLADVEQILNSVNFYKNKAKNLIALANIVVSEFNSELPKTHDLLLQLPGVGRKTANVVLTELHITPTFPVDTHVFRLAHRLGFSCGKNSDKVEEDLKTLFPEPAWRSLHHCLILHGRRVCIARAPRCEMCGVRNFCDFYKKISKE
jgi:endonuclease III